MANFFLRPAEACIGQNKARSSVANARELNPRVHVEVVEGSVLSKMDELWFRGFRVIVSSNRTLKENLHLDMMARKNGGDTVFVACGTHGFTGFMFSDAQGHVYLPTAEESKGKRSDVDVDGDSTSKKVVEVKDAADPASHPEPRSIPLACSFAELMSDAADWGKWTANPRRRINAIVFALQLLWHFQDRHGRLPGLQDLQSALALRNELCSRRKVSDPKAVISDAQVEQILQGARGEISPVCAITGGIVGQHLIRILTAKGKPLENFFIYDNRQHVGKVEWLSIVPTVAPSQGPKVVMDLL